MNGSLSKLCRCPVEVIHSNVCANLQLSVLTGFSLRRADQFKTLFTLCTANLHTKMKIKVRMDERCDSNVKVLFQNCKDAWHVRLLVGWDPTGDVTEVWQFDHLLSSVRSYSGWGGCVAELKATREWNFTLVPFYSHRKTFFVHSQCWGRVKKRKINQFRSTPGEMAHCYFESTQNDSNSCSNPIFIPADSL